MTHETTFSHIIIPLALLSQALGRIHRAGWVVETMSWDRASAEVLLVCSTGVYLKPLEGVVWAGSRSAAEALASAGLSLGMEKER